MNTETISCQNCNKIFTIDQDDVSFYEKVGVPTPTFCSECRMKRRMVWRNERNLYKNTCGICKRNIISIYSSEKPFTIYCNECFHSDKWDPISYGIDIDFSKPFLAQWRELQLKVPRLYAFVFQNVNSEYTNGTAFNKNCYLLFVSDYNEDSSYSYSINNCKLISDSMTSSECELCYENISCKKCYRVLYSEDCSTSQDLFFCKNCSNCHDCIGSVNLRNQQYCIFNIQYTKEEYFKKKEELKLNTYENVKKIGKEAHDLWMQGITKYMHGMQNINVIGDYVVNSKNSKTVFDSELLEDAKYISHGNRVKSSYDGYVVVDGTESSYEIVSAIALNNVKSSYCTWHGFDISYADTCENSDHIFGCVGIKKKQYCILNKQYSKEEYERLLPKIIEHMKTMPYTDKKGRTYSYGEYFPFEFSPFAYNETVAHEYFPLSKEELTKEGYSWKELEIRNYTIDVRPESIPNTITETKDDIIGKVISCSHESKCTHGCTTAFKLNPEEFQLYQKLQIPVPRVCPNCRHGERFARRNPLRFWHRTCMCERQNHLHLNDKCSNEFETSYAPERQEIVYCESCYQQDVV